MLSKSAIKEIQNCVLDLLPRAGQILRSYFHSENLSYQTKEYQDFATIADLKVNEFLVKALTIRFPQIPILSEEKCDQISTNPKPDELQWMIDPLDGTANFSRGDSNFSISVALVEKKQPVFGAIFAPVSSRLFWANRHSQNSHWNGRKLSVSTISDLNQAVLCTDWSHILPTRKHTTKFLNQIYNQIKQVKILGSAATDLTLLARGGVDIYHHVKLFSWDVAAAALIAQKAGAKVTQIDGQPWNVFSPSILAANPTLHRKIINI